MNFTTASVTHPHFTGESCYMIGLSKVHLAHFQMTRFKIQFIPLELISSASYQHEVNKTHLWFYP